MIKDFYNRFGIKIDTKQAQNKFLSRTDITIIKWFEDTYLYDVHFVEWLSEELGESWHNHINESHDGSKYISNGFKLLNVVNNQYLRCLTLIELIYNFIIRSSESSHKKIYIKYLDDKIPELLNRSEVSLGVFWKNGKFYPEGSEYLDKALVRDVLDWLSNHPNEKLDFEKALKALTEKRYNDSIGDCYNCIEGIARNILKNTRTLDNNKKDLLAKLNFSQKWINLISNYFDYANEFRHAAEPRHNANPNEVEAFIYLTGLITRAVLKAI